MGAALAGGGWHDVLLDNRRSLVKYGYFGLQIILRCSILGNGCVNAPHTAVWVWNLGCMAWLGNSDALNGISRGCWCRVRFGGWSSLQGSRQLYSHVGKAGLAVPSPPLMRSLYHHGQRQAGCLQPAKAWMWKLAHFGTFKHPTDQSSHRMCLVQRERAQVPRLSTRECQTVWPRL